MKTINNYIQEALIKKDTKLKRPFCQEYLIFVPWNSNYFYMKDHYSDNLIDCDHTDIFIIKKSEAINVFNDLPITELTTDQNIEEDEKTLFIFKIPKTIYSKNDLEKEVFVDWDDHPCNLEYSDHWDCIKDIDELK